MEEDFWCFLHKVVEHWEEYLFLSIFLDVLCQGNRIAYLTEQNKTPNRPCFISRWGCENHADCLLFNSSILDLSSCPLLFLLPLLRSTPFHSLLPPWSKQHLLKAQGLPSVILNHAADISRLVFNFLSSPLSSHTFPNTHWSTCEHVGPKV